MMAVGKAGKLKMKVCESFMVFWFHLFQIESDWTGFDGEPVCVYVCESRNRDVGYCGRSKRRLKDLSQH